MNNCTGLRQQKARDSQIAANAASNLHWSGRWADLTDDELDALVSRGQVEQRERDAKRGAWVAPKKPF